MLSVTILLGSRPYPLDAVAARWLNAALRRELEGRHDDDADVGLSVAWAIDLVLDEGSGYTLELGQRQAQVVRDVISRHYYRVRGDEQIDALYEGLGRLGGAPPLDDQR
jgi:hypothetical protein